MSIEKEINENIELLKVLLRYLHDDEYQEPRKIKEAIFLLGRSTKFLSKDNSMGAIQDILSARLNMKKVMESCDDRGNCYNRMTKSYQNLRKICDEISQDITSECINRARSK